jgi:hypothetical protein
MEDTVNIEQLPRDIGVKLENLRQRAEQRRAMLDGTRARIRDCESRRVRYANLVRTAGSDEAAAEAQQKLDANQEELQRLTQQRERHDADYRSAARDLTQAEDWLSRQPDMVRLRATPKRATEYSAAELAKARSAIAKLEAEIQQVESAPLDSTSRKAELAAEFERVLATAYWGDDQFGPKLCVRVPSLREAKPIEVLWWRYPEQRDQLLDRMVPQLPGAMPAAAKAEALERLRARLLTAERAEEALIEVGEAGGQFIERRAYVSPLALLGLSVVKTEAEAAAA